MTFRVLFSNLGYAKGFSGPLWQHAVFLDRHVFCPPAVQRHTLQAFRRIIEAESPDLCCLVEVERGSAHGGFLNQLGELADENFAYFDIASKYGEGNPVGRLPLHAGKSNAFLARTPLTFERLYFRHGTKRLIYRIALPGGVMLFFAHFSLVRKTRARQFEEMRALLAPYPGKAVVMGDFNILHGFGELRPLLHGSDLTLLNDQKIPTFRFHRREHVIDLCFCSEALARQATLKVVPQPFSDHAALLFEVDLPDTETHL